jgi:hypothetical protein
MKINNKLLSIPPYLSTSWENISSIQMDLPSGCLEINLYSNQKISIPNLSTDILEKIFQCHANSLEKTDNPYTGMVLSGMENFTGIMQHDKNQSNALNLPEELLLKVSEMGKAMGIDKESFNIPEGEPHCNCPYCQISRAIHGIKKIHPDQEIDENDELFKEELTFKEWDIFQQNDKLYTVTNPLDKHEKYSVYLGDPIGCTCGKNNCEHILAVLKS